MARIRSGFQRGNITDNPLTAVATSISSSEFATLPVIASPDILAMVLDPEGAFGAAEIVHVTAHTAAATTVTVTRGSAIVSPAGDTGTASREHPVNTVWRHGDTLADANHLIPRGVVETLVTDDSGAALDLDASTATVFEITLTGSPTFTFSGAVAAGSVSAFTLVLVQDATGSRTVTWPASVTWAGGTAPTLSTAAAAVDVLTFFTTDGGTTWRGFTGGLAFA